MGNVYVELQSGWGRRSKATWTASLGALFVIIFVVGWISTNFIALEYYGGSLRAVAQAVLKQGLVDFVALQRWMGEDGAQGRRRRLV